MCSPCNQRWQAFLNQEAMKKQKHNIQIEKPQESKAPQAYQKPNIEKVIQERREALEKNNVVKK